MASDGTFRARQPARASLSAWAPGWVAATRGPHDGPTFRLRRAATVRGRVVDEQGRGVADAEVEVWHRRVRHRPTTTDERGSFAVLDAEVVGEGTPTGPPLTLRVRAAGVAATSEPFDLRPGEEVVLPPLRLPARASWEVEIVDARGEPVPYARPDLDGGLVRDGRWDADERGVARVPADPDAETVTVRAPGHASTRRVFPPDPPGRWALSLDPARRVEGRVLDEAGKPVGGARVDLAGIPRPDRFTDGADTTTGVDGSFAFDDAPRQRVRLRITADEHAGAIVDVGPDDAARVVLRARSDADRALAARLRGELAAGSPAEASSASVPRAQRELLRLDARDAPPPPPDDGWGFPPIGD